MSNSSICKILSNFFEEKFRKKVKLIANKINKELKIALDTFSEQKEKFDDFYSRIPNMIDESVPIGLLEQENKIVSYHGEIKKFTFEAKDHISLGAKLNGIDFEAAAVTSGSGFVFLKNGIAKMQRALSQFMLDFHTKEHMYTEMYVPYAVNEDCLYGTGQLPKFREEQFKICPEKDLNLIATGEIPLVNYFKDKIIDINDLPIKLVASTPCFRKESGSYGKSTKGMIRQHQFEKVELVQFVHPENSCTALEEITNHF